MRVPERWSDVPAGVRVTLAVVGATLGPAVFGCTPPSKQRVGADLRGAGLTDAERQRVLGYADASATEARPAVRFPTAIALAEVTSDGGGVGFQMRSRADFPTRRQLDRLRELRGVSDAFVIDPRAAPRSGTHAATLRRLADRAGADVLMLYTFDGESQIAGRSDLLALFSLGLAPSAVAEARTTARAVLLDTRTGYVYGLAEASLQEGELANMQGEFDAVDDALEKAERRAFAKLMDRFPPAWHEMVLRYE